MSKADKLFEVYAAIDTSSEIANGLIIKTPAVYWLVFLYLNHFLTKSLNVSLPFGVISVCVPA